jgi:hypothetical protein
MFEQFIAERESLNDDEHGFDLFDSFIRRGQLTSKKTQLVRQISQNASEYVRGFKMPSMSMPSMSVSMPSVSMPSVSMPSMPSMPSVSMPSMSSMSSYVSFSSFSPKKKEKEEPPPKAADKSRFVMKRQATPEVVGTPQAPTPEPALEPVEPAPRVKVVPVKVVETQPANAGFAPLLDGYPELAAPPHSEHPQSSAQSLLDVDYFANEPAKQAQAQADPFADNQAAQGEQAPAQERPFSPQADLMMLLSPAPRNRVVFLDADGETHSSAPVMSPGPIFDLSDFAPQQPSIRGSALDVMSSDVPTTPVSRNTASAANPSNDLGLL